MWADHLRVRGMTSSSASFLVRNPSRKVYWGLCELNLSLVFLCYFVNRDTDLFRLRRNILYSTKRSAIDVTIMRKARNPITALSLSEKKTCTFKSSTMSCFQMTPKKHWLQSIICNISLKEYQGREVIRDMRKIFSLHLVFAVCFWMLDIFPWPFLAAT